MPFAMIAQLSREGVLGIVPVILQRSPLLREVVCALLWRGKPEKVLTTPVKESVCPIRRPSY